jgi:hypothetical protein
MTKNKARRRTVKNTCANVDKKDLRMKKDHDTVRENTVCSRETILSYLNLKATIQVLH